MLKSPDFTFPGLAEPVNKILDTFDTAHPQDYFSLYNTGKVKTMYPGQKFHHTWVNPKRAWQSIRLPTDNGPAGIITPITGTSLAVEGDIAEKLGAKMTGHVGWKGKDYSGLPITLTDGHINNYLDTGLPVSQAGPPYILCRMEVYPDIGSGGSSIKIYSQMHVHYEAEIEFMPLEKRYGYLPFNPGTIAATTTSKAFAEEICEATAGHGEGRVIGRVCGPSNADAFWA